MMTSADLRIEIDRIERPMLDDPTAIEVLRPAREAALAAWIRAEEAALAQAAEQELAQAEEQAPTLEQRWQLYKDLRILGRKRMSAKTTAKALRWLGPAIYRSIPW